MTKGCQARLLFQESREYGRKRLCGNHKDALNRAMFLGDASIPSEAAMKRTARAAVDVMIAAYAVR